MKKIVTHSGRFHADEVTACAILKILYPDSTICRTRDQDIIQEADLAVDVGKVYNPKIGRFDHHQEGCLEYFDDKKNCIPLSSAGMIYREFGKDFISYFYDLDDNDLDKVYKQFYYAFIQEIDAIDNGIKQSDNSLTYFVCTNISTVINRLNSETIYEEEQEERFQEGIDYVSCTAKIILREIYNSHISFKIDYQTIVDAFDNRISVDESLQILSITKECNNWYKCVMKYEKEHETTDSIKYIIYQSDTEWRVKTISVNFVSRKNLLSAKELEDKLTNPQDLVFVHNNLFIASSKTYDCAIEIARLSLCI